MLSFLIVFAVAVPLMIWVLSPVPGRKRRPSHVVHPAVDAPGLPAAMGALPFGSSGDAGSGGCDGGSCS